MHLVGENIFPHFYRREMCRHIIFSSIDHGDGMVMGGTFVNYTCRSLVGTLLLWNHVWTQYLPHLFSFSFSKWKQKRPICADYRMIAQGYTACVRKIMPQKTYRWYFFWLGHVIITREQRFSAPPSQLEGPKYPHKIPKLPFLYYLTKFKETSYNAVFVIGTWCMYTKIFQFSTGEKITYVKQSYSYKSTHLSTIYLYFICIHSVDFCIFCDSKTI